MKAVILAAGKGARLKEITKNLPKPMLLVGGKPIIQYNIEKCRSLGITELFINTHYLGEKIIEYFGDGSLFDVNIEYSIENDVKGTAGALNSFKDKLEEEFLVIYGDQYSNYDIEALIDKGRENKSVCTIAFHHREDTRHSGVAEFDDMGRVIKFIEKPAKGELNSKWVNAGIYYLKKDIFQYIPSGYSDFAKDIFPHLINKNIPVFGVCQNVRMKMFDTPDMYRTNINISGDNDG